VLALLVAAMTAIYLLCTFENSLPLGSILLAALYLFFQLSLITAVVGLGVFTSSVLATLLSFGVYLMGNFSQDLVELGRLSRNPGFQRLLKVYILSCLTYLD